MKTIQRKLREILGNAGMLTKHLACGNLPERTDLVSVWNEASGLIYKAHLIKNLSPNTVNPVKIFHNPMGLAVSGINWGQSDLEIYLNGVPSSAKLDTDKLSVVFTEYDNLGANIFAIYNIQSVIYQPEYGRITVRSSVYNMLTGTAVGFNTNEVSFGLEINAY